MNSFRRFLNQLSRCSLYTLAVVFSVLCTPVAAQAAVVYVDKDASPGGDGASWGTAYQYLQDALAAAGDGDEIWIAEGRYLPDEGAGRTPGAQDAFELEASAAGLSLYGGFQGAETDRAEADPKKYFTVLSGDVDRNDAIDSHGVTGSWSGINGANSKFVVQCAFQDGHFVLDGLVITGGLATELLGEGGGLSFRSCDLTLRRSTVVGNSSPDVKDFSFSGRGGGLYYTGDSLEITDSTFKANFAGKAGGGIAMEGETGFPRFVLRDVVFEGNANVGGLKECLQEVSGGGALWVALAETTIERARFSNNVSDCVGGAVNRAFSGTLAITGSEFIGNRAERVPGGDDDDTGLGGAIFTSGRGLFSVESSLFVGNTAHWGGAIEDTIAGVLTNVTIVGNRAVYGGGLLHIGSTTRQTRINNSIVYGNKADSGGDNIFYVLDASPEISHSLVEGSNGSGAGWNTDIGQDLGGNIDTNPGFVAYDPLDPLAGNLRLDLGSLAADAADDATALGLVDLDGKPRPFGSAADMGAYERQLVCPPAGTTRVYVDDSAIGKGDGSSWSDAQPRLQDALSLVARCPGQAIDTVWVAEGAYYPDDGNFQRPGDRSAAFVLRDDLAIFGGFEGVETLLSERRPRNFVSTLSGDIGRDDVTGLHDLVESPGDIAGDNSFHVVVASGTSASAVLDGFSITGGSANGSPTTSEHEGGGLFAMGGSPKLENLTFVGNVADEGGAMTLLNGSSPTLVNGFFAANAAADYGGAIHLENSSPTLVNVLMSGNRAVSGGGAIYNLSSNPELVNVTIAGNVAGGDVALAPLQGLEAATTAPNPKLLALAASGGGIFNFVGSKPKIKNSIIWNNSDDSGVNTPSSSIRNQDTGSTPTAEYSNIAGLASITGLLFDGTSFDSDPLFVQAVDPASAPSFAGSHQLLALSPAIDMGDNTLNSLATDLSGDTRVQNTIIDLGPYEHPPTPAVAISKTADRVSAGVGDTITYTYAVTNTSNGNLSGVAVDDDQLGPITLSSGSLKKGETATSVGTYSYTVVEADLPGPLTNTATVTSNQGATAQGSASVRLVAISAVDLAVNVSPNPAIAGRDSVVFDYTVTNVGNVTLSGLALIDQFTGTVALTAASLAPGEQATGSSSIDIESSALPALKANFATVQATAASIGRTIEKTVKGGFEVKREADFSITITPPPPPALTGTEVQISSTISNLGPSSGITSIVAPLKFKLPNGPEARQYFDYCTWSCDEPLAAGAYCLATNVGAAENYEAGRVELSSGASVTMSAVCRLDVNRNQDDASIHVFSDELDYDDPIGSNDRIFGTFDIEAHADLAINVSSDRQTAAPGDEVKYFIQVSNQGLSFTHWGIGVQDLFPNELVNCGWTCSATLGKCTAGPEDGDISEPVDPVHPAEIKPGGSLNYEVSCTVGPVAPGVQIVNEATVEVFDGGGVNGKIPVTDPNLSDNNDSVVITVVGGSKLSNISTRADVGDGDRTVIAGFVIRGDQQKCVVLRGRGQSVPVAGNMADPKLTLKSGQLTLDENDNWRDHPTASILTSLGRAPAEDSDAAFHVCLDPGPYTALLRRVAGSSLGIGIVEVIDADGGTSYLKNISTRAYVEAAQPKFPIAGFIISGNQPRQVLIRGRGPSLASAPGITSPVLGDPRLVLKSGTTTVATNDNWRDAGNWQEIEGSGFAPGIDEEAAILVTLQPGPYTVWLQTADGVSGLGIVEVLDMDNASSQSN